MLRIIALSLSLATSCASVVLAEKNALLEPTIATVASPQVSETFDSALPPSMVASKGQWSVIDGVLVGKELAADKHAAVLTYQKPNRNSVVRFSFKADGKTNGLNFSLNHDKGHLFRIVVTSSSIAINLDKDKQDPKSKPMVLATAKGNLEKGEWHTIEVEMVGERVVARTDSGLMVEASHKALDRDKPNYRFVMTGDSLSIDDLTIWELN